MWAHGPIKEVITESLVERTLHARFFDMFKNYGACCDMNIQDLLQEGWGALEFETNNNEGFFDFLMHRALGYEWVHGERKLKLGSVGNNPERELIEAQTLHPPPALMITQQAQNDHELSRLNVSEVCGWLHSQFFDPRSDLCEPKMSKRVCNGEWEFEEGCFSTAMHDACANGKLEVCKWLFGHGSASTVCAIDYHGETPMICACKNGHVDVAKWLFDNGAEKHIRTPVSSAGYEFQTPLHVASSDMFSKGSNLEVVKWLCSVGAVSDIHSKDSDGFTPIMCAAQYSGSLEIMKWLFKMGSDIHGKCTLGQTMLEQYYRFGLGRQPGVPQWLILQGAANDRDSGHIDPMVIQRDVFPAERSALRATLLELIDQHRMFVTLVLPALASRPPPAPPPQTTAQVSVRARTAMAKDSHTGKNMMLIADYVGVVRGRQLRNAHEAVQCLA